jgi:hypothetical protein
MIIAEADNLADVGSFNCRKFSTPDLVNFAQFVWTKSRTLHDLLPTLQMRACVIPDF